MSHKLSCIIIRLGLLFLFQMVDIDVCAGGDSTRRKMDSLTDSAAEIIPLELYDSSRAKIAANLQWICAKAYGIGKNPHWVIILFSLFCFFYFLSFPCIYLISLKPSPSVF